MSASGCASLPRRRGRRREHLTGWVPPSELALRRQRAGLVDREAPVGWSHRPEVVSITYDPGLGGRGRYSTDLVVALPLASAQG